MKFKLIENMIRDTIDFNETKTNYSYYALITLISLIVKIKFLIKVYPSSQKPFRKREISRRNCL